MLQAFLSLDLISLFFTTGVSRGCTEHRLKIAFTALGILILLYFDF